VNADAQVVEAKDRAAWRRWLTRHHARGRGVWLVIHKKASRAGSLSYEDAVLEALCFGWIDSTAHRLDAETYKLWLAPRKPKGVWSAINKERVARLIDAGLMQPSGLAAIEAAKANGSWAALDRSDALVMPDDLAEALAANPDAARHFEGFPPSTKKQVYFWIENAKRPETRAKRVAETVAHAAENRRVTEWRPKEPP
jgi:uncharacterized protein YdeI (YjbR/CyaY-like superfamily)